LYLSQDKHRDLQKFIKGERKPEKRKLEEETNSKKKIRFTNSPNAMVEPFVAVDTINNVDTFDGDSKFPTEFDDDSNIDIDQPVLLEEELVQLKQHCDEVDGIDFSNRIPDRTEFTNIGDFYQANFAEIINSEQKKRLCLQVSNYVSELLNDVMAARDLAKQIVPHKNENLDKWRLEMAKIMSKKVVN